MRNLTSGPLEGESLTNSWYVVQGHYFANPSDAARVRRQEQERQARDAARRSEWMARHARTVAA